jgi:UDP-3-O-[3-hydroxymyristoyl] glucosamine N-acyltransferase
MKFPSPWPLGELAAWLNVPYLGDPTALVTGMNEIHKVTAGDLSFVDHPKYYDKALQSEATFILINKEVACPDGKGILISDDPFRDFNAIRNKFRRFEPATSPIHPDTLIGEGTHVQPGVFIGPDVVIGKRCIIHANVVIYGPAVIGDDVIIHAGTIIGADAFYFKRRRERELQYDKLLTSGRVIIEQGVEIGAACTIDNGVSGDTVIGAGSKLDNQVHVAHGAVIGKNCLIAAQVGIAGKTILEDEVILWGQVGVNKSLRIGKGAEVYAQSGVPKSIEGGKKYFGSPVQEARAKMKELALLKQMQQERERNGEGSNESGGV